MNTNAIVITEKLIQRIQSIPETERKIIFDTFVCEEIFKTERYVKLSPFQEIIYAMIKDSIKRDSYKYNTSKEKSNLLVS